MITRTTWVSQAACIVAHTYLQVHLVSHSYGTFVASRMLKTRRESLASLTLIDPVCKGMCVTTHATTHMPPGCTMCVPYCYVH